MGKAGGQRRMRRVSYHHLPNGGNPLPPAARHGLASGLEPPLRRGQQSDIRYCDRHSRGPDAPRNPDTHPARRRAVVGALPRPARTQLGPLCTTDTTPADQQIDACNKIIALKVFSGEKLASIYFWRAVGWNKKGNYSAGDRGCRRSDPAAAERARLQSARLGLLRQGRVRHRDRGFQRRAADRAAERHHLPQPRQRLALARATTPRRSPTTTQSIKLGPPSAFSWQNRGAVETGARRSRWRAGRHQRSDPARPGVAAAADQPRGDLARQGRSRSRHCRRHRSDPAREGKGAGQHHDAARQRADLGLHAARPRLRSAGAISTAPDRIMPPRSKARPPTPAARPTRQRRRFACRCCRRPSRRPPPRTAKTAPRRAVSSAPSRRRRREPAPACRAPAAGRTATGRRVALVIGNGAYAHVRRAAQSDQRCTRDRKEPARHRIRGDRRHRSRPRRDADARSATSCAMRRGRRSPWSTMPDTACRSTAATTWCRSISSFAPAAA